MKIEVGKRHLDIVIVALLVLLLVMSLFELRDYSNLTVRALGILTVATYGIVLGKWYVSTKKVGSLFFIFMLMCFFFNAGQIILGAFDLSFVGIVNIYDSYSNRLLAEMMLFQSKAVLALGIGGLIAYDADVYNLKYRVQFNTSNNKLITKKLGYLEKAYLIVYVLTLAIYLKEFIARSGVSYGDYYYGEREGVNIYLLFAYHVLMYVCFMKHDKDRFMKWLLWGNVFLAFIMLMIGSRNATLQLLFGCLFIYMYVKRDLNDIPFKQTVKYFILGLILLLIFTGFQDIRQMSFSELSMSGISEIYSGSIFDGLVESLVQMGGTARCLLQTMYELQSGNAQPEQTLLYAFARGIIPIPILSFLGIDAPTNHSLATWITEMGGSQAGWGYSIFAEMYYNYQNLGWLFGFFFSFIYVTLEQKALKLIAQGRLYFAASLIYVLAYAVFVARSDMLLITSRMRICVYIAIISAILHQNKLKSNLF